MIKKTISSVICLVASLLFSFLIPVDAAPLRINATEVADVSQAYIADDWLVAPEEESQRDQRVSNTPECDIMAVIGCFDDNYLRVDILLHNSISYDKTVWYAVEFKYTNLYEIYTYYPVTKDFIYEEEVDGKIVKTLYLKKDSRDVAGVGSSSQKDDSVYFILDKEIHIDGIKGKRYFLTCTFLSGFVDTAGELKLADETVSVEVEFTK